jgi:hypothetical protein
MTSFAPGDPPGRLPGHLERSNGVVLANEHERRHLERGQDGPDVDQAIHPSLLVPGARRPHGPAEPHPVLEEGLIVA